MQTIITTRVNAGIYDLHASNGVYLGRVQKSTGGHGFTSSWQTFIGHKREYDNDFTSKRAAVQGLLRAWKFI